MDTTMTYALSYSYTREFKFAIMAIACHPSENLGPEGLELAKNIHISVFAEMKAFTRNI